MKNKYKVYFLQTTILKKQRCNVLAFCYIRSFNSLFARIKFRKHHKNKIALIERIQENDTK